MSTTDEAVKKDEAIARLRETNRNLLATLIAIAAFAVGNGDICDIIAKRARAAIAKAEEK